LSSIFFIVLFLGTSIFVFFGKKFIKVSIKWWFGFRQPNENETSKLLIPMSRI
jgi:hypothetical protein